MTKVSKIKHIAVAFACFGVAVGCALHGLWFAALIWTVAGGYCARDVVQS